MFLGSETSARERLGTSVWPIAAIWRAHRKSGFAHEADIALCDLDEALISWLTASMESLLASATHLNYSFLFQM
jgi:hypothetical protein